MAAALTAPLPAEAYESHVSMQVYDKLVTTAARILAQGCSVIVDAAYLRIGRPLHLHPATVDLVSLAHRVVADVVTGTAAMVPIFLLLFQLDLIDSRFGVVLVLSGGNIDVTVVARIIERGLVKDGRLVRLGVLLRDQPGALASLTALIAAERANILQIEHNRAFSKVDLDQTAIDGLLQQALREIAVEQIGKQGENVESHGTMYRV